MTTLSQYTTLPTFGGTATADGSFQELVDDDDDMNEEAVCHVFFWLKHRSTGR
jgi:hypothetical protein